MTRIESVVKPYMHGALMELSKQQSPQPIDEVIEAVALACPTEITVDQVYGLIFGDERSSVFLITDNEGGDDLYVAAISSSRGHKLVKFDLI